MASRESIGFGTQLRLLGTHDGGRSRSCWSGYAPNLRIGNELAAVSVVKMDGTEPADNAEMVPGKSYEVLIVLWYPHHHSPGDLDPDRVQISEGPKLIAEGTPIAGQHALVVTPPSVDGFLQRYAADQDGTLRAYGYPGQ